MSTIRRLYFAIVAFIAMTAAAWGGVDLVSTLARSILEPQSGLTADAGYWREQIAWAAATLIISLPLWLVHWRSMLGSARRSHEEATSVTFRFYVLLVSGVAAIVALIQSITLLQTSLLLIAGLGQPNDTTSLVRSLGWIAVWGALWFYHAPFTSSSAPGMADSTLRRWYLYVVTVAALSSVANGLYGMLNSILNVLLTPGDALLLASGPRFLLRRLFDNVPQAVLGGVWWYVFFRKLAADDEGSLLRRVYLYGAMAVGMVAALTGASQILYEFLRFLFGYRATSTLMQLNFLADAIPLIVIGVPAWWYHQALTRDEEPAGETPARIYRYLLAAAGLSLLTVGMGMLLRLLIDFAVGAFPELRAADWWRDTLSLGLVLVAVGLPVWLSGWATAQRAAAANVSEVTSMPRRAYLFVVLLVAVLAMLGFGIAALYGVLQLLLGAVATASSLSDLFSSFGSAAIAAGVLAYHGLIARSEMAVSAPAATQAPTRHRVLVLTTPDDRATADALARQISGQVEIRTLHTNGTAMAAGGVGASADVAGIVRAVAAAPVERVLVVLRGGGADVYPYE